MDQRYILPLGNDDAQISVPLIELSDIILLEIGCKPTGKVSSLNLTQRGLEMDWRFEFPNHGLGLPRINKFLIHYDPRKNLSMDDGHGNTLDFVAVFTEFPETYLPRLSDRKIEYLLRTVLTRAGPNSKSSLREMIKSNDVSKMHKIITQCRSDLDLAQFRGELVEGLGQYLMKKAMPKGLSLYRNVYLGVGGRESLWNEKEVDGISFPNREIVFQIANSFSTNPFLDVNHRWH